MTLECREAGRNAPADSALPLSPTRPRRIEIDGRGVFAIPLLGTDCEALIDPYDFHRLRAAGVALPWSLAYSADGSPFVAAPAKRGPFRIVSIPRLVIGAAEGARVGYRDGNRLNLTRANLSAVGARGARLVDEGDSE